jgi:hypothetical protein
MKRIGQLTSDNMPSFLSHESFDRISEFLKNKTQKEDEKVEEIPEEDNLEEEGVVKISSLSEIPPDFKSIGTMFYRQGHSLWQLKTADDGLQLVRSEDEPRFDEDEVVEEEHEACPYSPKTSSKKMAKAASVEVADRLGQSISKDDVVEYKLNGYVAHATVSSISKEGFLNLQVGEYQDKVPPEFVQVLKKVSQDFSDPNKDQADNDQENMVGDRPERPKKQAVDEEARKYWSTYFKDYGESLISEPPKKKYTEKGKSAERVYNWDDLSVMVGKEKIREVKSALAQGIAYRNASVSWNLPLSVTEEVFSDLCKYEPRIARKVVDRIKKAFDKHEDLVRIQHIYGTLGFESAKKIATLVKEGRVQKQAVDTSAEEYYISYFGEFGKALVQEIKKRIHADLFSIEK